jgi:hypothetical protein
MWGLLFQNFLANFLVGRFHGSNLMPLKIGSPGWRCGTTTNEKPRMTADTIGFLESVV